MAATALAAHTLVLEHKKRRLPAMTATPTGRTTTIDGSRACNTRTEGAIEAVADETSPISRSSFLSQGAAGATHFVAQRYTGNRTTFTRVDPHGMFAGDFAAAGAPGRVVQHAFRRHYDTTPMNHLRRVRLHRAHHELRAADPGGEPTIAGVAARCGSHWSNRALTAYQSGYGVTSSRTLHS